MKNIKGSKRGYIAGRPKIPIDQYSLTGKFITSFISMREAARMTKAHFPHILACINGRMKKAGGYIWMLKDLKPSIEQLERINKNRVNPVYQYDFNGNFITEYSSQKEAAEQTGICGCNISSCITKRVKSAGGYLWTNKINTHK